MINVMLEMLELNYITHFQMDCGKVAQTFRNAMKKYMYSAVELLKCRLTKFVFYFIMQLESHRWSFYLLTRLYKILPEEEVQKRVIEKQRMHREHITRVL